MGDLALWVPTLFLVYVFASQGVAKFSDESGWAKAFAVWHFPVWFRILIGFDSFAAHQLGEGNARGTGSPRCEAHIPEPFD